MLPLLLSHFSRVQLCVTPETAAHQVPPSLGFSRQEHWSGLPFPSPMHESEKWKWSRSVVSDLQRPQGLQPTRLLRPRDFPGKSTGVGCHYLLWYFDILGIRTCEHMNLRGKSNIFGYTKFVKSGRTKASTTMTNLDFAARLRFTYQLSHLIGTWPWVFLTVCVLAPLSLKCDNNIYSIELLQWGLN